MEYNNPSEIVKDLHFEKDATDKIVAGVEKLAKAVSSTLGASGNCVIYEDALGKPIITKDGVTVAESVVLMDPVENIGATLIKEAAKNTVKEAGDGTTTATVLSNALLKASMDVLEPSKVRVLKNGIEIARDNVLAYLDKIKMDVKDDMLQNIATISTNNDKALGKIIGDAYQVVGKNGIVLMEESDDHETKLKIVDGVQFDSGLKSSHLTTNDDKTKAELDNPYVLIVASEIPNIRKIQSVLEHVIKEKRSLLIVASLDQQPFSALLMNKVKGNIKVNIVDLPGFGPTKRDTIDDLAALTGAYVVDEELGDDLDLIQPAVLGECNKAVTDNDNTVITIDEVSEQAKERIELAEKKLAEEKNPYLKKKIEQRLSMLSGSVAIVEVGAQSKVELKEKKDRVDDALQATRAAIEEGIVVGGGVALLKCINALNELELEDPSEQSGVEVIKESLESPITQILQNAGLDASEIINSLKLHWDVDGGETMGFDAKIHEFVDMFSAGIIDPKKVTREAIQNASSVVGMILTTECMVVNKKEDKPQLPPMPPMM